jgi:hypothetical protein
MECVIGRAAGFFSLFAQETFARKKRDFGKKLACSARPAVVANTCRGWSWREAAGRMQGEFCKSRSGLLKKLTLGREGRDRPVT